ncbi:MAG TPA: hypothetical protein VGF06_17720 [Terriglobales bacterium]
MKCRSFLRAIACSFLPFLFSGLLFGQNSNCTIIVPDNPLSATGLATPYQLKATNPDDGACSETNTASSAFVQAGIIDPATGQISIYNPLVIDAGSVAAIDPVVPILPDHAIVALWFGFNGDDLVQEGAHPGVLEQASCVNGISSSVFGQFSYCNAAAFFKAANRAIRRGQLRVPYIGRAADGLPCPTVRDFFVVDQDQSDNLPVTYLISAGGLLAQSTQANAAALPGASVLGNPSDEGLLDRFLDPDLGCAPWKAADLADPGQTLAALPLNELQAKLYQRFPEALIPAGNPMVLDVDGGVSLEKTNAYRKGVDQPQVAGLWRADTARYCRNMLRIAPARLLLDKVFLIPDAAHPTRGVSPAPDEANSMFTFLAQRFVASFDILGCARMVNLPNPISVTTDDNGVAVSASVDLPLYGRCRRWLSAFQRQDDSANSEDAQAAAGME